MRLPSAGGWWSQTAAGPVPYSRSYHTSANWQSEGGVVSERKELLGFVACDADYSCALHPTDPQVRIL